MAKPGASKPKAKPAARRSKSEQAPAPAAPSPDRRSPCPVACTLDLLGDKWTLLIVRDMLLGRTHYHEFLAGPEKIATNILADRLEKLTRHGLAQSAPSAHRKGAQAYTLTPKGKSLEPVLTALRNWGLAKLPGTAAHLEKPRP